MTWAEAGAPRAAAQAYSVAQVIEAIRELFEARFPSPVWVEGELSNCSHPASGHIYFTLVDEKATDRFGQRLVLPCAFFKGLNQNLKFKLLDGMKVLVLGQVTVYEGRGQYQLRVMRVEAQGAGALQIAFEQLKKRLAAEGLFDEERKRPLPPFPETVGLITSGTGSAVHDMVDKLRDRFHVRLLPVRVQGEGAAQEIAAAIELADRLKLADVLIVGRGGGSVEDLWAFNEEAVARALAACSIPTISAVGHEDDWTIADYVADHRASTPTAAAQQLAREQQLLLDQISDLSRRLADTMAARVAECGHAVASLLHRLRLLHPRQHLLALEEGTAQALLHLQRGMRFALDKETARLAQSAEVLNRRMRQSLDGESQRLAGIAGCLQALSPLAVLARGYSITFAASGKALVDAAQARPGDLIRTRLAHGEVESLVQSSVARPEAGPGEAQVENHG